MYNIIDGKKLAGEMRSEIKTQALEFKSRFKREVGLAVVLAGDDAASQVYVKNKIKACEEVGIKSFTYYLPNQVSQNQIEDLIKEIVGDDNIDGVLVQLPLPPQIDAERVLKLIPSDKDVDGFSAENMGKLCIGEQCLVACTPHGVLKALEAYNVQIKGRKAVIVGRSNIVGKPLAMLLINADATVTVCHSKTENLKDECINADILIAAVGKAKFITAEMIKPNAVVVDVGINRDENGKLCGDVDFESVKEKCSYITPVPGGIGPMTITMLMYNTVTAAFRRKNC